MLSAEAPPLRSAVFMAVWYELRGGISVQWQEGDELHELRRSCAIEPVGVGSGIRRVETEGTESQFETQDEGREGAREAKSGGGDCEARQRRLATGWKRKAHRTRSERPSGQR